MSALKPGSPHLSHHDYTNMVWRNTQEDNRYWTHFVAEIAADVAENDCFD